LGSQIETDYDKALTLEMITSSLFGSLFGFAIILTAFLIGLAFLFGHFILKPESIQGKVFTIGFDFLAILIINILLASWVIRDVAFIGDETLRFVGFVCVAVIVLASMQKFRNFFSQRRMVSMAIFEICILGILPYPLFVINLSLHHYGSVRTMSYVENAAYPSFVMIFLGIYFALKFYAAVINRNEVATT
jgi:hypothetical protein